MCPEVVTVPSPCGPAPEAEPLAGPESTTVAGRRDPDPGADGAAMSRPGVGCPNGSRTRTHPTVDHWMELSDNELVSGFPGRLTRRALLRGRLFGCRRPGRGLRRAVLLGGRGTHGVGELPLMSDA